jgi:hypothetical protein
MEYASRTVLAAQFVGTNSQELLDIVQAITQYTGNVWSIHADSTAERLVLREMSATGAVADWPVLAGQWMVVAPDFGIVARLSDAAYRARYRALDAIINAAVAANLAAIAASEPVQTAIKNESAAAAAAAAKKAMYGGIGAVTLPTLLAGATSAALSVPLRPVQPDDGYTVGAFALSGAAVLSAVEIVSMVKAAGSVAVVVKNTGLVSLGGLLLVHVAPPSPVAAAASQAGVKV